MITKVSALLLALSACALALVLSYYLNVRFDHNALINYLRSKFGQSF
jgi:hypothetical protein